MTDNKDDILICRFFSECSADIADNGFSRRVMKRLPARGAGRAGRLWQIVCLIAGVAFFILNHGWDVLTGCLKGIVADIVTLDASGMSPTALLISLQVFVFIFGHNIVATDN